MTQDQVIKLLGKPVSTASYSENDRRETETWSYRTYYFITCPALKKEEAFTTLYFRNGILVDWRGISGRGELIQPKTPRKR
jgi:hypothetical protein